MHMEALKVFCDLASLRNFSKAAAANELSQPTVTRLVQHLEDRLGGELIDRSTRPLQLTELGQAYYAGCKRLLEQYVDLEASLRRSHNGMAISVRVAAIYSVGLWDMGQYVERFAAQFPHAKVYIDYLHPKLVYERVLDGTADIGLVSYPSPTRELDVLPWREEEMVVACPPAHALGKLRRVSPQRLRGQRFVAFDKGLVIRQKLDRFLRDQNVEVEVACEFDNIETIKKGIESGAGIGLLPEPMLRQEVHAGTLKAVRLEGVRLMRPLGIILRRGKPPGGATQGFIELLRENGTHAGANGKARRSKRQAIAPP
jgi:DNA-binding transcriptional LysR family regulator